VAFVIGATTTSPRQEYPITAANDQALIQWPWKLIVGDIPFPVWTGPSYPNASTPNGGLAPDSEDCQQGCLYNLETDPTEHNDVAAINPALVAKLKERLAYWVADMFDHQVGPVTRAACEAYLGRYNGYFGPFSNV
jgi:hypothetical protein